MNYAENPITDLADCVAHAQYLGFSDIDYDTMKDRIDENDR